MLEPSQMTDTYRRFGPMVLRRACKVLGNEADAREVVQDLLLSLFEKPAQFSGASSMTTFLYAATTNACLTRPRNQRGRERLRLANQDVLTLSNTSLSQEQLLLLRSTLQKMPEELYEKAQLRWAFAPKVLLGFGAQF